MAMYGWFYLAGVAVIVLFWAIFMAPAERRQFKRRLKLIQDRIRKREKKAEERERAEKDLELERRRRSGRRWNRYRPPSRK